MDTIAGTAALWLGKLTLAILATKAVYRGTRFHPRVPVWLSSFVAGMTLVSVLWALSGVKP